MIAVTFRPIDAWPGQLRHPRERKSSPFGAAWSTTLSELDRELRLLDAESIIVQVALRETQIRRDGWPKQGAAAPEHPGVILAFDSRYGPLKYATDLFTSYEDNLRAITLGLESLRRVDRYGITKRGEQYSGWKQLTAGPASDPDLVDQGRALIAEYGGDVKRALRATHPDAGGDEDEFKAINAAREAGAA